MVLDAERGIRFVNERARRLLGYGPGDVLGGRCRKTTMGVDCADACPLSFALESGLELVEGFAAVYQSKEGRPVPLKVTVVPLHDASGGFAGAVEILRPAEPDPGFFLSGRSKLAGVLRGRVSELADGARHLALIGGSAECEDVARTVHRFAGLEEGLFRVAGAMAPEPPAWPPATCFIDSEDGVETSLEGVPEGWRVILGLRTRKEAERLALEVEVLELPSLDRRRDDVPAMIAAWVDILAPGTSISSEALCRLCELALERGLGCLEKALGRALAVAGDEISEAHLPAEASTDALLEMALAAEDPLAEAERRVLREVLERCCWRIQDAADRLGVSRVTLWRKLRVHGIAKDNG